MCGVIAGRGTGAFDFIKENLNVLARRGPDNQSIVKIQNDLVFGATRLAMTDPLPRSNQPFTDSLNGNVLIFNGEIYNYKEVRDRLVKSGVEFKTESDTEVLLKALAYFGLSIIRRLEGMFAFIFFNKLNNELIISRDYLGKKPLYYYLDNSKLFFSSQVNLVQKYIANSQLDLKSLSTYLELGYVIDPDSMIKNIKAVKPGEIIIVDLSNNKIKSRQNFLPEAIKLEVMPRIRSVIKGAIEERIDGHNEFALSLSGGIDSTILAIECSRLKLPVTAFSLRWLDSDKDRYNQDAISAEKIAKKLDINFKFVDMPKTDYLSNMLDEYVSAIGEPNSNPTGLSMMALYSDIKRDGHRLVLTGDGADEIFGGYERYTQIDKFRNFPSISNRYLISMLKKSDSTEKLSAIFFSERSNEPWKFWHVINGRATFNRLFPNYQPAHYELNGKELSLVYGAGRVSNMMFRDLRTWLPMESNRKLDRISMWNSIEARSPFQSEKVISHGLTSMRMANFRSLRKQTLYSAYPELKNLPINQNKLGFISPVGHWLRNNPELVRLTLRNLPNYIEVNKAELANLSDAPTERNFQNIKILWSLVVLNKWFMNQ